MDDDRIDFSALDLKRDPARFERMVRTIVASASAPPPSPLVLELVGWGRAAVALAALVAFIAWLPSMLRGGPGAPSSTQELASDPVELVSTWAQTGQVPSNIDLVQALGGGDAR